MAEGDGGTKLGPQLGVGDSACRIPCAYTAFIFGGRLSGPRFCGMETSRACASTCWCPSGFLALDKGNP